MLSVPSRVKYYLIFFALTPKNAKILNATLADKLLSLFLELIMPFLKISVSAL